MVRKGFREGFKEGIQSSPGRRGWGLEQERHRSVLIAMQRAVQIAMQRAWRRGWGVCAWTGEVVSVIMHMIAIKAPATIAPVMGWLKLHGALRCSSRGT